MAEKDLDTSDGPSLELPSFGLGSLRRRRKGAKVAPEPRPATDEPADAVSDEDSPVEPAAVADVVEVGEVDEVDEVAAEPVDDVATAEEPEAAPLTEDVAEDSAEDSADDSAVDVAAEPEAEPEPAVDEVAQEAEPTADETPIAVAESQPDDVLEGTGSGAVAAYDSAPTDAVNATADTATALAAATDEPSEDAAVEPDPVTEPVADAPLEEPPAGEAVAADDEAADEDDEAVAADDQPVVRRERKPFRLPRVSRAWAVGLTGALIGFLLVGLVNLALHACDWMNGTKSCGGPGLFLLLAILVVLMTLATRILRAWDRDDAGTVAFLGVGLAAVIALVLLADQLLSIWMVIVIPFVTIVSFLLAHWVSETIVGEEA